MGMLDDEFTGRDTTDYGGITGGVDRGGRAITRGLEGLLGRRSTGPRSVFGAPEAIGGWDTRGGDRGGMLGRFGQQQPGMMGSIYQGNPYLNQGGPPGSSPGAPMMSQGDPQTIQELYSMYGIPMQQSRGQPGTPPSPQQFPGNNQRPFQGITNRLGGLPFKNSIRSSGGNQRSQGSGNRFGEMPLTTQPIGGLRPWRAF